MTARVIEARKLESSYVRAILADDTFTENGLQCGTAIYGVRVALIIIIRGYYTIVVLDSDILRKVSKCDSYSTIK